MFKELWDTRTCISSQPIQELCSKTDDPSGKLAQQRVIPPVHDLAVKSYFPSCWTVYCWEKCIKFVCVSDQSIPEGRNPVIPFLFKMAMGI